MVRLPADEDYARALLSIFKLKRMGARQSLRLTDARTTFLGENMGRSSDFDAALDYAKSLGWLSIDLDRVRLTAPGAEEMASAGGLF